MHKLGDFSPDHFGRRLLTGLSVWYACQRDQRFSYGLYVPNRGLKIQDAPVLILVHGTGRDAQTERESWTSFADKHNLVIFVPLFPAGISSPDDVDGYKTILDLCPGAQGTTIRYDQILLGMLEEVSERYHPLDTSTFFPAGHSGGAQFTLRMLYLHPEKLEAAMISAPGRITIISDDFDWPLGTADVVSRFPDRVNGVEVCKIRKVPTLLTVGSADTSKEDLAAQNDDAQNMHGLDRVTRICSLEKHLLSLDLDVDKVVLEGGTHSDSSRTPTLQSFLHRQLTAHAGLTEDAV